MQDVSDKLLQAFVACIEKQLAGPQPRGGGGHRGRPAGARPQSAHGLRRDRLGRPRRRHGPTAGGAGHARPPRRVSSDIEEDAPLDLGSAVMPVLIQRYAGYAAAAAIGIVLGWLIGRSRGS